MRELRHRGIQAGWWSVDSEAGQGLGYPKSKTRKHHFGLGLHITHSYNAKGHAVGDRAVLPVLCQHGGREGLAYLVAPGGSVATMALERQLI